MLGFRPSMLCFDFGSANLRVGSEQQVLVTQATRAVVYAPKSGKRSIVALGNSAKDMQGRLPSILQELPLVQDGGLQDVDCLQELVRQLIIQVKDRLLWANQQVCITIPYAANQFEKQVFVQMMKNAGAGKVHFVNRAIAAAEALEIPYHEPHGHCVIDIGAHTMEMTILSCGTIVHSKLVKLGGGVLDQSLLRYLRKKFEIDISKAQACQLKEKYGQAYPDTTKLEPVVIRGKNSKTGYPIQVFISQYEIHLGLGEGLQILLESISGFLEEITLELSTDIAETGIVLIGGGALLGDLEIAVTEHTNILTIVPENPDELCVVGALSYREKLE